MFVFDATITRAVTEGAAGTRPRSVLPDGRLADGDRLASDHVLSVAAGENPEVVAHAHPRSKRHRQQTLLASRESTSHVRRVGGEMIMLGNDQPAGTGGLVTAWRALFHRIGDPEPQRHSH